MRSSLCGHRSRRCRLDVSETGHVVPPRDAAALARACEALLNLGQRVAARWARRRGLA